MLTLAELIEELVDIVEADADLADAPVQLAVRQKRWPLAMEIETVTVDHGAGVIWIAEGTPAASPYSPYAPDHAWDGGEVFPDDDEDERDRSSAA